MIAIQRELAVTAMAFDDTQLLSCRTWITARIRNHQRMSTRGLAFYPQQVTLQSSQVAVHHEVAVAAQVSVDGQRLEAIALRGGECHAPVVHGQLLDGGIFGHRPLTAAGNGQVVDRCCAARPA
ncbi:hypothetical protein D3C77_273350 [compost metagenome]